MRSGVEKNLTVRLPVPRRFLLGQTECTYDRDLPDPAGLPISYIMTKIWSGKWGNNGRWAMTMDMDMAGGNGFCSVLILNGKSISLKLGVWVKRVENTSCAKYETLKVFEHPEPRARSARGGECAM